MEGAMDKKFLCLALITTLASVFPAEAQQPKKVPTIGVLRPGSPPDPVIDAFHQGLRELGYNEGKNIALVYRFGEGKLDRLPDLAADLVRLKPDIIVTSPAQPVLALKQLTTTIPIVMNTGDPVAQGIVDSLARPGGNITGMSAQNSPELAGKRLELLKEAFPSVSRVGLLVNRTLPHRDFILRDFQRTALAIDLKLQPFEVSGPEDFAGGLTARASATFQALVVHPDPLAFSHRREIAEFGLKKKMPVMAAYGFAEAGCLMSYDLYWPDAFRRAAIYVDKILKGAKPADLPIEQPTKFYLIINLKTAKALGLTIPPSLLQRADEVIQ